MNASQIENTLEGMTIGMTRGIGDATVTRWSRDRFEVGTWGRETVSIEEAVQKIKNS